MFATEREEADLAVAAARELQRDERPLADLAIFYRIHAQSRVIEEALRTARAVVAPNGWFSFSVFHPCYPGGWEGSPTGLPSWPPGGYAQQERWSTNGEGVRGRVGANHRMLSTYLNAALQAGFEFEVFYEPPLPLPVHLAARCRPART